MKHVPRGSGPEERTNLRILFKLREKRNYCRVERRACLRCWETLREASFRRRLTLECASRPFVRLKRRVFIDCSLKCRYPAQVTEPKLTCREGLAGLLERFWVPNLRCCLIPHVRQPQDSWSCVTCHHNTVCFGNPQSVVNQRLSSIVAGM